MHLRLKPQSKQHEPLMVEDALDDVVVQPTIKNPPPPPEGHLPVFFSVFGRQVGRGVLGGILSSLMDPEYPLNDLFCGE